jgi:hypothetical protein
MNYFFEVPRRGSVPTAIGFGSNMEKSVSMVSKLVLPDSRA